VTQPIIYSPLRPDILLLITHLFITGQLTRPATAVASEVVVGTLVLDPHEDHREAFIGNDKRLAKELFLKGEAHKETWCFSTRKPARRE